jgi:transcriptional regulator with XRE-family HTH domain
MSISISDFDQASAISTGAGAKVKAAREAAGYSIEDLAVTCGLANSEISAIEEGIDADPAKLRRIAPALQIEVSDLLAAQ